MEEITAAKMLQIAEEAEAKTPIEIGNKILMSIQSAASIGLTELAFRDVSLMGSADYKFLEQNNSALKDTIRSRLVSLGFTVTIPLVDPLTVLDLLDVTVSWARA